MWVHVPQFHCIIVCYLLTKKCVKCGSLVAVLMTWTACHEFCVSDMFYIHISFPNQWETWDLPVQFIVESCILIFHIKLIDSQKEKGILSIHILHPNILSKACKFHFESFAWGQTKI